MKLEAVLCTHRHWDHVSGVCELASGKEGVKVYTPVGEEFKGATEVFEPGKVIEVC